MSSALGTPISRGNRVEPPHAGMMPSWVSGRPILVHDRGEATRQSQARQSFVTAAERGAVDRGDRGNGQCGELVEDVLAERDEFTTARPRSSCGCSEDPRPR